MMLKRSRLVFQCLDNWFPNCSEDIRKLGINETTRTGDLDKDQYYKLYTYMKQRPDYKQSTFLEAAAKIEDNLLATL